jgi:hypothetical protein
MPDKSFCLRGYHLLHICPGSQNVNVRADRKVAFINLFLNILSTKTGVRPSQWRRSMRPVFSWADRKLEWQVRTELEA